MSEEYETEPIPGLPAYLPEGEKLLWQGAPSWISAASHIFHARAVAAYFAALIVWRIGSAYWTGDALQAALGSAIWLCFVAAAALGLLSLLAWLTARTTIYSITSRRVVMRYGIAMPMTVNVPFKIITSADLSPLGDGTGNIALSLTDDGRLAYFHLWPHARPWYVTKTQPMLRSLPDPAKVANLLSRALADGHPEAVRSVIQAPAGGLEPVQNASPAMLKTA